MSDNNNLKYYFENIFNDINDNIKLDNEQINAILNDDDATLVLAGAGTGKTTTIVGKVKYLVDIKKINPKKILVLSYTKKAVLELKEIINDEFKIPAEVTTFHSLAYFYVKHIFKNKKCEIIDYNEKEEIFYNYINQKFKTKEISKIIKYFNKDVLDDKRFLYGKFFLENYNKYNSYNEFFNDYKLKKLTEAKNYGIEKIIKEKLDKIINSDNLITIKGEFVKSVAELKIANFLFIHGIDYYYEKVYSEIVEDDKIYKPDFTIDYGGTSIYLEYFGLNDKKYNKIKSKKIELHRKYQNKFIYLENVNLNNIDNIIDIKLRNLGIKYNVKSPEEIYETMLSSNKLSQIFKLKNLFYDCILQIKSSKDRLNYRNIIEDYIAKLNSNNKSLYYGQYYYLNDFYHYYFNSCILPNTYRFDYADLIYYSNLYIQNLDFKYLDYDYIIIDEYQDITDGEYELSKRTSKKNNAKIFAVGDDWQSIYSFNGSKINYITNFKSFFKDSTILTLSKTYRKSQ